MTEENVIAALAERVDARLTKLCREQGDAVAGGEHGKRFYG